MVFINEFLETANIQGQSSDGLDFFEFLIFLLIILGIGFLLLMKLDELFFHEKVVLDSFQFELSESALGDGGDWVMGVIPDGSLTAA